MRQIRELHNIMPISNIPSVIKYGILSHNRQAKRGLSAQSVAMQEIQGIRAKKRVPGGRSLHSYANLYFNAHNAMLSKRRSQNQRICILRIAPEVLTTAGVVISDQNAASNYAQFRPYPKGLSVLDFDMIDAESWIHADNQILEWRHKSVKCAEVLVPDRVAPEYIIGAYVCDDVAEQSLRSAGFPHTIEVRRSIFFW